MLRSALHCRQATSASLPSSCSQGRGVSGMREQRPHLLCSRGLKAEKGEASLRKAAPRREEGQGQAPTCSATVLMRSSASAHCPACDTAGSNLPRHRN